RDAEANLAYLQKELATAQMVALQESIGRLIEGELQSLMLAKGNEEFAFRVIDPAVAPKWRSRPRRLQIVVLSIIAGGLLGCMIVFARHASTKRRSATDSQ
ncbi:MAG: GNVR domain-containing protein, partial [Steroidobacteraceae bacterium]